jgi:uncharacterized lipoprotein YehR (DUF1307 family)
MKALRSIVCAVFAMGLLVMASGCTSEEESTIKGLVGLINDAADVMEGVKSKDDIPGAKKKLAEIGKKINGHKAGMEKVEKLPDADREALMKKYEPEMKKANERMHKAGARLEGVIGIDGMIELMQALGDEMLGL